MYLRQTYEIFRSLQLLGKLSLTWRQKISRKLIASLVNELLSALLHRLHGLNTLVRLVRLCLAYVKILFRYGSGLSKGYRQQSLVTSFFLTFLDIL